jgi:hypothetical protein
MKIRPQRGLLAEAMAEVEDIEPTREAVAAYLNRVYGRVSLRYMLPEDITVEPYCHDRRTGWNTHVICEKGCACGFTDGPLQETANGIS